MTKDNVHEIRSLCSGTTLNDGKYTIESKIGEGGFGITYKAIQNGLNRCVCIKEYFINNRCVRDPQTKIVYSEDVEFFEKYRQSFIKEARTVATLHHPGIVEVIDVFDENGTSYMVMPFIKGETLQHRVDTHGKLSCADAINYIAQISDAVGYLHEEKHLLHRDIKPDNIMLTEDYMAILIDFGSAKDFVNDKTQSYTVMVTQGYAPPEQYEKDSRKGYYTDIYAIGATLYFALTGEVPLLPSARVNQKLPSPKSISQDIPDEVNRTVLKAMQLKPENRHKNICDFMDDLRNIKPSTLVDETIGTQTPGKKFKWIIGTVSLIAVILLLFLIFRTPKDVPSDKDPSFVTMDFTGMNLYPMIKVKGGKFVMGDKATNEIQEDCPPHTVYLNDFYIGQFEVSREFWKKITGSDPSEYNPAQTKDGRAFTQEMANKLPVENVSFKDVQRFISILNKKTGVSFSLPTEAQWEYAARGGDKLKADTRYANGKSYPVNIWYGKENPIGIKFPHSHNELGIYQMSGNVAEWCLDYYDENYYFKCANKHNPCNTDVSKYRVIRGGSFNDSDEDCSVYYRTGEKDNGKNYIGFRLVVN